MSSQVAVVILRLFCFFIVFLSFFFRRKVILLCFNVFPVVKPVLLGNKKHINVSHFVNSSFPPLPFVVFCQSQFNIILLFLSFVPEPKPIWKKNLHLIFSVSIVNANINVKTFSKSASLTTAAKMAALIIPLFLKKKKSARQSTSQL